MTPAARRAVFVCYAVPLFVATHWPALTIPVQGRWDLLIHFLVFGGWTVLFTAAAFFGEPLAPRNIVLSAFTATIYAAIDESLQAIPFIRRTAAWDDFGANVLGVWIAGAFLYLVRARLLGIWKVPDGDPSRPTR